MQQGVGAEVEVSHSTSGQFARTHAPAFSTGPLPNSSPSPATSIFGLLIADLAACLLCIAVVVLFRSAIWGELLLVWPFSTAIISWILFRFGSGLYPPTGLSQPEELRLSSYTAAGAALVHLAMLIATGEEDFWPFTGLITWVMLVPTAYMARSLMTGFLIRRRLYGEACIVVGTGEKARRTIREIKANPELGLVPVAAFGEVTGDSPEIEGIPILGPVEAAISCEFPFQVGRALVALSRQEADAQRLIALMEGLARPYSTVQVVADLASPTNLLVMPRPIGPYLSMEIQHQRFSRKQRILKRIFDLAIAGPAFIAFLPFIGVAALLVKIFDPSGPIFFSQTREGAEGQPIRIWKIRTMVTGAERRLAEYLASNPAARFEYERTLKLRNDPRIIPKVGKYLRRYSVDELPQLWSVIRGDMSLVGPRVMLGHEVERFSEKARQLRRDVPPGLTGFWQVMYRNNSDLQIWEVADSYYVNNWSVWLDGWIVLRTVRVVLTGAGAY
ncbi:exopolysaccharide biosynthesis polyprenyl glycosylphosphotransferase [Sabulicella rubraurantiaca]|uniref:exopolysaccharide biosynthesis polyprenyl glycosylphosphotransferase n=1 Tax=Sabulicella rubraurantiaca TaxID=2811429 RepID=UPI001F27CEBC|nr:exopolysaccharide biosynthesis polyprenyl glycosylphosphotransferase [Sabulicella rubraurantiaca]